MLETVLEGHDPFGFLTAGSETQALGPNGHGSRRFRVLLIAEACNPEWESVPLVGYNLYRALSKKADVTLVTQIRNRSSLLRHVDDPRHIVFINSEALAAPFHRVGRVLTLGRGLGWTTRQAAHWAPYLYFEHLVFKHFRRALATGEFDLIHRITPLTPTHPSPIASWSDVPFVLGPINGGLPWPEGTTGRRWAEMEWLSYVRHLYRILPYSRRTYRRAAGIFAGSTYTLSVLPADARRHAVFVPENGIDPQRFHPGNRRNPSEIEPFRILFVGRLVPYKGADMVLEAVAGSEALRAAAEVTLVGDGPQRKALETLVRRTGLNEQARFVGRVPQTEVPRFFRQSSVFAFPSLREFGGGVAVEAMACGLPSIVLDYGGPGEHVNKETGFPLACGARQEIVEALRNVLEHAMRNPAMLDGMSAAGIRRVRELYTWERKAQQIVALYRSLVRTFRPGHRGSG